MDMSDSIDIEDEIISALTMNQLENILKKLPQEHYQIL